jgi:2-C-methyl-D-erythritol 2,4-cyclodiphosphate synthase
MSMRIGHGYDVHRLVSDRALILGGVTIPYEKGLLGHSDADVLLHAVMDAVLGAMGAPDIGHLFPDKDEQYRGISSMKLTEEVARRMRDAGYAIGNIDVTIIAQRPKLAPYLDEMKNHIARAFFCDVSAVNIKATTEEGLGFTGEGQGIAAHAVCLLVSP